MGGRRLDSTPRTLPSTGDANLTRLRASAETPRRDPGEPGSSSTESFDYSAPDMKWPAFDAPMEVLGHAVLPLGVDHAPLVLFLHGRHIACYGIDDPGFWPCVPGSQPVPSYLGYRYLQQRLASQGYATVSISANAVNAQDGNTNNGGVTGPRSTGPAPPRAARRLGCRRRQRAVGRPSGPGPGGPRRAQPWRGRGQPGGDRHRGDGALPTGRPDPAGTHGLRLPSARVRPLVARIAPAHRRSLRPTHHAVRVAGSPEPP